MLPRMTSKILCALILCGLLAGSTCASKNKTYFSTNSNNGGLEENLIGQILDYTSKKTAKYRRKTKIANGTYLGTEAFKTLLRSSLYAQLARSTNGDTIKTQATINAVADLVTILVKVILGGVSGVISVMPNFIDFLGSLKMINKARAIANNNKKYGVREFDVSLLMLLLSEKGTYGAAKIMDIQDEPIYLPGNVLLRITSFALWITRRYYEGAYIDRLLEIPAVPDDDKDDDFFR